MAIATDGNDNGQQLQQKVTDGDYDGDGVIKRSISMSSSGVPSSSLTLLLVMVVIVPVIVAVEE
jgi:hypothetical protein